MSEAYSWYLTSHLEDHNFRPQLYWLKDRNGQLPFDFIGRFENLEEDFAFVCNRLGIEDPELPKLILGDGSDYVHAFTDKTRQLIYDAYREEIELFRYRFSE